MSPTYEKSAFVFIGNEHEHQERNELIYKVLGHGDTYSLLVIMTDSNGLNDSVFVYDITHDEAIMIEIVELLSEHTVTPCSTRDTLEDLLSELNFHHAH